MLLVAILAEIFTVTARLALVAIIPLIPMVTRLLLLFALRRLVAARWLDAAQSAAQFFQFAFVHHFLTLGDFDEFEHFVELINHVLQRNGNFRGVFYGLCDGRTFRRTEISWLHPRLRRLAFRLGQTFLPFLTLVRALVLAILTTLLLPVRLPPLALFWANRSFLLRRGFGLRFNFGRVSIGVVRRKVIRFFRVGFAKSTRVVGFRFVSIRWSGVLFGGFLSWGNFFGFGRGVFIRCGTGTTSPTTTTTTATTAICGAQWRGRLA